MRYLIFDFDGVLGNTYAARLEVLQEMKEGSKEEIVIAGDKYFTKSSHTRDLNISKDEIKRMNEWTTRFGELIVKKDPGLFTEFIEEIRKIKDAQLAVVSSGSGIYIKPKLKKSGLVFTHVLTFEDHHSKEEKVERICKDWGVSTKDVYFFTDTISDVVELENLIGKEKIYGCAWGYQGHDKLVTVLDEKHILKNFSDIQNIMIP